MDDLGTLDVNLTFSRTYGNGVDNKEMFLQTNTGLVHS